MQPAVINRSALDIILSLGSLVIFIGLVGGGLWFWLKRSGDPRRLIFKWVLSAVGLVGMVAVAIYIRNGIERGVDYGVAFFGVGCLGALGIYFTIIWRHEIAGLVAKPFGA